jgi:mRNA interferase MazF
MRRGEVRWYRFASPDKRRPVVILTRESVLRYLGVVTVAPVTSVVREIPSEVALDEADGMRGMCAVNCDHLQTVSTVKIGALITTLGPQRMSEVARAVSCALALS